MLVDGRYVIFWTRQNPPSMTQIFKFHKLNTINNFYFFIILYDSISYASQMDIYQEIKKKYGLLLHYTPIFHFFRNEWTFFLKMCHFVKCYSIWTNQLAQGSDQFPLFTQRDNLFITLYFFIWWHVQQRSFFKWKNVTAWKSTKITIDALISEKMFPWDRLFSSTLLHTTSAHIENKPKLILVDFYWNSGTVT